MRVEKEAHGCGSRGPYGGRGPRLGPIYHGDCHRSLGTRVPALVALTPSATSNIFKECHCCKWTRAIINCPLFAGLLEARCFFILLAHSATFDPRYN
jgi:hypothetical protein